MLTTQRTKFLLISLFWLAVAACHTVNERPDILAQPHYRAVKFVNVPDKSLATAEKISVTTRGYKANLQTTIPKLYDRAIELAEKYNEPVSIKQPILLSDISIRSFSQREEFQVPYQYCRMVTKLVQVPKRKCLGFEPHQHCFNSFESELQQVEECETRFRTEMRDVLYQQADAFIYLASKQPQVKSASIGKSPLKKKTKSKKKKKRKKRKRSKTK